LLSCGVAKNFVEAAPDRMSLQDVTNTTGADAATDAILMRRIGAGDRPALAEMVHRHEHRVRGMAYRFVGSGPDADDIAQETFIRLWQAAPRYEPSATFTTWMYRIVVNLCLDRKRRVARAPQRLEDEHDVPQDSSAAPIEQAETVEAVRRAIDALPERQRTVLLLHRYESLSYREIAQVTQWSESAVESLLVRAYQGLRQRLARFMEEK